ncbi:MAG: acylphosphatase [Solirubrobacteraceae bacterium]|nr:acylphosphatase [Solirubrobacteraceae bacterium]
MVARRAIVTGDVQGVFFRAHVADAAERVGVSGWAANRDDGSVEIHAEGAADAVEAVLEAARSGSSRSRVEHVDVREAQPEGCSGFASR